MGWQQGEDGGAGFGDVQPRYVFQVPLANRSLEEVHKGFNQLWRRNIKKAEKAGVEVVQGGYEDLDEWQRLYEITAERDQFRPRPLSYFQRMWTALNTEDPNRMRLYFARHEGVNLVGRDDADRRRPRLVLLRRLRQHRREVRPSNAMQWRMLRDAYALGATVYDLRGISDSLDETDHLFGLIQFKVGTGRRGRRVPRRVGLPAQQAAAQGARHLHVAPLTRRRLRPRTRSGLVAPHTSDTPQPRERFRYRPWRSPSTSTPRAGGRTSSTCIEQFPGLVPVCKGNGYGFGHERLAEEATRFGADILAVGTTYEAARIKDWFGGDLLVLTPVPAGRGAGAAARPGHPLGVLGRRRVRPGRRPGRHRGDELA